MAEVRRPKNQNPHSTMAIKAMADGSRDVNSVTCPHSREMAAMHHASIGGL